MKNLQLTNLHWLWLSVIVIALDQITKYMAVAYLAYGQPLAVLPFLNFTLIHNPGAAFSFLSTASGWQRWLFTAIAMVISVAIVIWLLRLRSREYWAAIGLSLVLGGAIGNLIDRLIHGYVIDFIHVYYQRWSFPDFNVADSAITIGAVCIIVSILVANDS